jgi:hypothetical protein
VNESRSSGAGYSGTPLAKKLSLRDGMRVWWEGMPARVREEIFQDGLLVEELEQAEPELDSAHIFVTDRAEMEDRIKALRPLLAPSGFIWVSWPKKSAGVLSDISEDRIREAILPETDLVDVKVCAIDETWSGLKLMIRRERRSV